MLLEKPNFKNLLILQNYHAKKLVLIIQIQTEFLWLKRFDQKSFRLATIVIFYCSENSTHLTWEYNLYCSKVQVDFKILMIIWDDMIPFLRSRFEIPVFEIPVFEITSGSEISELISLISYFLFRISLISDSFRFTRQ